LIEARYPRQRALTAPSRSFLQAAGLSSSADQAGANIGSFGPGRRRGAWAKAGLAQPPEYFAGGCGAGRDPGHLDIAANPLSHRDQLFYDAAGRLIRSIHLALLHATGLQSVLPLQSQKYGCLCSRIGIGRHRSWRHRCFQRALRQPGAGVRWLRLPRARPQPGVSGHPEEFHRRALHAARTPIPAGRRNHG